MRNKIKTDLWHLRAAAFLLGIGIFRLVYLAIVPFDLVHDEAYYWDWSRQLDWCYYSKPPGIAWLIAAATRFTAATPFFVRLPAALLSTMTVAVAYALATHLYDTRVGFWAAVLTACTPGNAAMGVMMTIDAPLLFCWTSGLYCFWRMIRNPQPEISWVVLSTVCVATGLLFKQTMIAFPILAISFLVVCPEKQSLIRNAKLWVFFFGSLLGLFPMLIWNVRNGWITLVHTTEHFQADDISPLRNVVLSLEFLGSQLAIVSPTTWLFTITTLFAGIKCWRKLRDHERYLVWFSAGPLAAVLLLSLFQKVEPNWPAPFYIAALILLSGTVCGFSTISMPSAALARAVAVGCLSVAVTYALPFVIVAMGWKGTPVDVAVRMWGWREFAHRIAEVRVELPPDTLVVVIEDRAATSELAFYLPDHPDVYLWRQARHIPKSQYDLWGLPRTQERDALILSKSEHLPPDLKQAFQSLRFMGEIDVPIGSKRSLRYQMFHGRQLLGWDPISSQVAETRQVTRR